MGWPGEKDLVGLVGLKRGLNSLKFAFEPKIGNFYQ